MGLAILPPRLKTELREVEKYLLDEPNQMNKIHLEWANELKENQDFNSDNIEEKVRGAVGDIFLEVLEDAGVFKNDAEGASGFAHFIAFLND